MPTRTALSNQLRAELERFWPGAVKIFRSLDSPIALAFLEKYPSLTEARALGEQRLAAFLRHRHYRHGKTPAELLRKVATRASVARGEQRFRLRTPTSRSARRFPGRFAVPLPAMRALLPGR